MINHARTLLLNKDGDKRPASSFFLEEYVPTDYKSLNLSKYQAVRDVLLGAGSDDSFLNYKLRQYMKAIHSTDGAQYVYDLDKRITYDSDRDIMAIEPTTEVQPMTEVANASDFIFLGNLSTADDNVLRHAWSMKIVDTNTINMVDQVSKAASEIIYSITEGLSDIIYTPGTDDVYFRLQNSPPVNAQWLVTVRKRPDSSLTNIISRLEKLGAAMESVLFSEEEPYSTFRDYWIKHPYWTYRLTGVLLALIYRSEAVRNGQ